MVRRSVLVYDLLRSERSMDGLSEKEILQRISDKYDIYAGKGLRRQIAVALRRGIDFGIVRKRLNKYRFDPDFLVETVTKRQRQPRKKNQLGTRRRRGSMKRTPRRRSTTRKKGYRKGKNVKPKPKFPTLPPWTQERRDLRKEAIPRVVKHR